MPSGETSCRGPGNPYSQGVTFFTAQQNFAGRAAGIAAVSALFLLSGSAPAQSKSAATDLRMLRAAFRQGLLTAILPEKRAHADRLLGLERKLASARDYANAIKVRDERLALEQELAVFELELPVLALRASGKSALMPERIVFSAQEATLSGVKLDNNGSITGWESAGGTATWSLPQLPEGGYEAILKYICSEGCSAAVEVRESFYMLRSKVALKIGNQLEKNLGTLRIRKGDGTLTLAVDGASPSAHFRLIALELAPVNR